MPHLTLRDVPVELHEWLKQQAAASRRSLNQEVILRLDSLRQPAAASSSAQTRLAVIQAIAARTAKLPVLDHRSEDDILGFDTDGLPTR
jgi:antitoxin VapB